MKNQPELQEKIPQEELAATKKGSNGKTLLFVALGAFVGLVGAFLYFRAHRRSAISMDDLRKAYPGLGPDEEN